MRQALPLRRRQQLAGQDADMGVVISGESDGEPLASAHAGRLAAGIVLFGPQRERLLPLIAAISPDVGRVYLFVNGRLDAGLRRELAALDASVELINSPINFGIATALNMLTLAAALAGFEAIFLFDQDSRPTPGMARGLADTRRRLVLEGAFPAIVGPLMVTPEGEAYKSPRVFARTGEDVTAGAVPVDFLATSGSLLDIAVFRQVGQFRDDYFIDAVDVEWCFRAWAAGFSVWLEPTHIMPHTVGEGEIRLGPVSMPRQKLFRMASYVRNSVYGLRLRHLPRGFRARQALYLPAQCLLYWRDQGYRLDVARRLARAAIDGARGRLGPPADAPEN